MLAAPGERAEIERILKHHLSKSVQGGAIVEVIEAPAAPAVVQPQQLGKGRHTVDASDPATALNLARFHLPSLLPSHVSKVLYIDTDTLVLADVVPLVEAAFVGERQTKHALAVVPRAKPLLETLNVTEQYLSSVGLSGVGRGATMCFNAGVMILNLDVWRASQLTPKLLSLSARLTASGFAGLPGMSTPVDSQSVLNLFFQNATTSFSSSNPQHRRIHIHRGSADGGITYLPTAWNIDGLGWKLNRLPAESLCTARVLHWSGGAKPWTAGARKSSHSLEAQYVQLWRERGGE